jgi:hypothetical protein
MSIFSLKNQAQYFVPDQATLLAGQSAPLPPYSTYVIGSETDARNLLATEQQQFFNSNLKNILVQKSIIDKNDNHSWEFVDLNTEPLNTDVQYNLLNWPNGNWLSAIGLDNAKNLFNTIKQNSLIWANLDDILTFSTLPVQPPDPPTV